MSMLLFLAPMFLSNRYVPVGVTEFVFDKQTESTTQSIHLVSSFLDESHPTISSSMQVSEQTTRLEVTHRIYNWTIRID